MYGRYHYHQIFRKSIIAFGTLFNNIIVKRKDSKRKDKNALESYKVPCLYGPYQKYLAMIASEPIPERQQVQISLPRISFEIKGLNYDGRKLVPTQFSKTVPVEGEDGTGSCRVLQYLPVPYNLEIEMVIAKNRTMVYRFLSRSYQIPPH